MISEVSLHQYLVFLTFHMIFYLLRSPSALFSIFTTTKSAFLSLISLSSPFSNASIPGFPTTSPIASILILSIN